MPETNSGTGTYGLQPESLQAYFLTMTADRAMELIFFVSLNAVISVAGSAANAISIIVFFKQGFTDSVNISLCALACSDLGALVPLLWKSIAFNPKFLYSDIGFDSAQVQYISAGWSHRCFVRITSWITAFITFERCVCVAMPMKVKDIITRKRTLITIIAIFIIVSASVVPVFLAVTLTPVFNVQRNKTLLEFSYTSNGLELENVSFNINVIEQLSSAVIVTTCTAILIHKLFVLSQWRHQASGASVVSRKETLSLRDQRVVKMVATISCIFIACFLPGTANITITVCLTPDYRNNGRYHVANRITWTIFIFLEAINSSINILVYYNMSSKFRATFKTLFCTSLNGKHSP